MVLGAGVSLLVQTGRGRHALLEVADRIESLSMREGFDRF
jgi:hypothetical protein